MSHPDIKQPREGHQKETFDSLMQWYRNGTVPMNKSVSWKSRDGKTTIAFLLAVQMALETEKGSVVLLGESTQFIREKWWFSDKQLSIPPNKIDHRSDVYWYIKFTNGAKLYFRTYLNFVDRIKRRGFENVEPINAIILDDRENMLNMDLRELILFTKQTDTPLVTFGT